MAEIIMFPQQRHGTSEDYIEAAKRVFAKQNLSGTRVRSAPFVEIMPQVVKDLRCLMETLERDAREGREGLAILIGMYEYMLDEGRAALRAVERRARKNSRKDVSRA